MAVLLFSSGTYSVEQPLFSVAKLVSHYDRNDGRNGYGEIIFRYAGRLAVVRHHILRSAHPDRIPVAFPNLENDNVRR